LGGSRSGYTLVPVETDPWGEEAEGHGSNDEEEGEEREDESDANKGEE